MAHKIYYPYKIASRNSEVFALWMEGISTQDTFLCDDTDTILLENSRATLIKKSRAMLGNSISFSKTTSCDFNQFRVLLHGLKAGKYSRIATCIKLNNGWNFLEDLLRTVNAPKNLEIYENKKLGKTYNKIFCGCNLPSITPEGRSYNPIWQASEIEALKRSIKEAILYLKQCMPKPIF